MPTRALTDRLEILFEITDCYQKHNKAALGKSMMQQLIFLLQAIHRVDSGYDFMLYPHGPYSSSLESDLDMATALNVVKTNYDFSGCRYELSPGEKPLRVGAAQDVSGAIDIILNDFGSCTAKTLELRATTVYAARELRMQSEEVNDNYVIEVVQQLKPHLERDQVVSAYCELKERGYLAEIGHATNAHPTRVPTNV